MPNYIRIKFPGGLYFFTLVTFDRRKFLTSELSRRLLRQVWREAREKYPFTVEAICVLPDHLHCIWRMPEDECDYPKRWQLIKGMFTRRYLQAGGQEGIRNQSRQGKREAAVWQRRYWEHTIRSDVDFARHVDYIHFNPVKHGYVSTPVEWPWSSYHRYLKLGYYLEEEGCREFNSGNGNDFGE